MRPRNNLELVNKDHVILKFVQTCEQVGAVALLDVKQDSPLVKAVDMILQHGLKDPVRGYWFLVRGLTHSSTLKSLEAFVKYISSSQQKGLAWTFYTLDEGSIEYYMSSLAQDQSTLQQHYLEPSLLRDKVLSQRVVAVISNLRAEAAAIQSSMETSMVSDSTGELDYLISSTPSLTSPVDSGVALLDSDASTCDLDKNEVFSSTQCELDDSWKLDIAGSVNTRTSTSSNTTLGEESDLQNCNTIHTELLLDNKPKPAIIAQNKTDGVCRRPRKKKKSESGKRVSFHQDSNDNSQTASNLNKFYVEGRYSWGGESDSFYLKEANNIRLVKSEVFENKGLTSNINIFESEMGIEADCESSTTTLDEAKNNIEIVCEKLTNVVKHSLGLKSKEKSLPERGVPEGQEDPAITSELQHSRATGRSSIDCTSDSEWSLDTADKLAKKHFPAFQRSTPIQPNWPARILYEAPSKTSLVKRFLRSIPVRKPYREKKETKRPNLYIKGVKPDPALCQDLCVKLEMEINSNKPIKVKGDDEMVSEAMKTALEETVLLNNTEKIYKVYRVASTEGVPLLAVLTDSSIYMTGLNRDNAYSRRHHIPYTSLDSIVIGPECQTVMLVTVDPSVSVTVISALGHAMVTHMVTHLALAVCRVTHSHLSVSQLSLSSMQALYKAVLSQTSVTKDEKLHYYRYIRVEDSYISSPSSTQGCHKTGHLMYRSHNHSPWLPGYILLKGGILCVFTDTNSKRPKHVLSFHVGYFGGCRRVQNSNRPHTFEILPFSQRGLYGTFQFAAADDYEASEWLQAFIQTSSCVSESSVRGSCSDPVVGCGLLLTSRHLITLDFPDRVLSSARLQDITSIHTDSTCCILETSCREVQDSSGDWILYFLTEQAISEFLDMIYTLRPELKEAIVTEWECEALHSHCVQTSRLVQAAWDPLLQPCLKHYLR